MPKIITLGEMLIDFVPTVSGMSLIDAPAFIKAPGGAPANVAVGVARLGVSSGFMGQVGDDAFGHFLALTLRNNGVDTSELHYSAIAHTALAFVSLMDNGERDFMFYRHPSADMLYCKEQVDIRYFSTARIFHFGSLSLISEPARGATLYAVAAARSLGVIVSYDPNLRLSLWPNEVTARAGLEIGWQRADVIKASEEEIYFLSEETDLFVAARRLWTPNLRLLVVTRGAEGCVYFTPTEQGEVAGFNVDAIDTTGAGDGFMSGLLTGLLQYSDAWLNVISLTDICRTANAVGALTATGRGAIPSLPTADQVQIFLKQEK